MVPAADLMGADERALACVASFVMTTGTVTVCCGGRSPT